MRVRTLSVGIGVAAALVLSSMTVGTATATSPSGVTATPSGISATLGGSAASTDAAVAAPDLRPGKCGTTFGAGFDDGIISWAGGGLDVAGAADFVCPRDSTRKQRKVTKVTVHGYFGDPGSSGFNVTFYKNSGGEPDDSAAYCSTTGTGAPTGATYPVFDVVVIPLDSACRAKTGTNWVSVQADSSVGAAWYWRTQSDAGGNFEGDWRDTGDAFATGCTTYQNGRDMESCIFGGDVGQNDFMFKLN